MTTLSVAVKRRGWPANVGDKIASGRHRRLLLLLAVSRQHQPTAAPAIKLNHQRDEYHNIPHAHHLPGVRFSGPFCRGSTPPDNTPNTHEDKCRFADGWNGIGYG